MRRRTRAAALAAGLALAAVPVRAIAAQDLVSTPGDEPLSFEKLAPGHARTATIVVTNPSDQAAEVSLSMPVTSDNENGCVRPETRVSTEGCDSDGGELADWLRVTASSDAVTLWEMPLSDLADPQPIPGTLGAGDSREVRLAVALPLEAGNDTMTDELAFDLAVTLVTATGDVETEVLGVEAAADGGPDGSEVFVSGVPHAVAAGLSSLGLDALAGSPRAQWGLTALATGLAALALALRRRRRRPA